MDKIKCMIVDDEPLALEVLKSHLAKMETIELVNTCNDAIESYNLNILDYLLKPISFGRFMQAIEKFNQQYTVISEVSLHKINDEEEYIYLRERNVIHKIPVSEIIYIESFGDYLQVHTPDREIRSRCTISAIENTLPERNFIRMHRSYIIALNRIQSFSPVMAKIGEREFPFGSKYKDHVFARLDYDSFMNK